MNLLFNNADPVILFLLFCRSQLSQLADGLQSHMAKIFHEEFCDWEEASELEKNNLEDFVELYKIVNFSYILEIFEKLLSIFLLLTQKYVRCWLYCVRIKLKLFGKIKYLCKFDCITKSAYFLN